MYTLTNTQLANLKKVIAEREGTLQEDITDEYVFVYLDDITDDDGIHSHGSDNTDDWDLAPVETKDQKVESLLERKHHPGTDWQGNIDADVKTQSIPNGTECKFRMRGLTDNEFDFIMSDLDGMNCTVVDLETATELGSKDHEYYNLYFPFYGRERFAVSGYHLTPIKS